MKVLTVKASAGGQTGLVLISNSSSSWTNVVNATAGTTSSTTLQYIRVLNDGQYDLSRTFMSFDTSSLPDDCMIISAKLYVKLEAYSATGINISGELCGWVTTDETVDNEAFDEIWLPSYTSTVSGDNPAFSVVDDWYSWDFTTEHNAIPHPDIYGTLRISKTDKSSFLIRDVTQDVGDVAPTNGQNATATFYDDSSPANVPYLEVEYYIPKEDWQSSGIITVTNSTGGTLTDFQVKIELDSTFPYSDANANGDDIRFTLNNELNDYYYWIEKWNDGGDSIIWVKVTSLVNGTTDLKMWWNNPAASSESDGPNTFIAWDDFEDYTAGDPPSATYGWSVDSGTPTIENAPGGGKALRISSAGGVMDNAKNTLSSAQEVVIQTNYVVATQTATVGYYHTYEGATVITTTQSRGSDDDFRYYTSAYNDFSPAFTWVEDTWDTLEWIIGGNDFKIRDGATTHDGALRNAYTDGIDSINFTGKFDQASIAWINNFFVRKYASSDPTHGDIKYLPSTKYVSVGGGVLII